MTDGANELPNEEENNKLEAIYSTLKEILKWTRFANIARLKEVLGNELDDEQKKLAFENSDGINGLKELAEISGAPLNTIYNWWQRWSRLGLVTESETRKGRMVKIVSLDDVGIKIPKKSKADSSPKEEQPAIEEQKAGTNSVPQQEPIK